MRKRTNLDFDDIMPRLFTPKNKCGWLDIKSEKRVVLFPTKYSKKLISTFSPELIAPKRTGCMFKNSKPVTIPGEDENFCTSLVGTESASQPIYFSNCDNTIYSICLRNKVNTYIQCVSISIVTMFCLEFELT